MLTAVCTCDLCQARREMRERPAPPDDRTIKQIIDAAVEKLKAAKATKQA